jgi:arylsulfatase A-like enzyme
LKRRLLLVFYVVVVVAAGIVAYQYSATEHSDKPPNILLIVLDDFGYNDLGANGNPETPTPRLDALAVQGARYTRHYADATCSVARAALMTGTFPAMHGLRPNHLGLSVGTPTIASVLREANYRTEHIGKWHIASATLEQSPIQLGFDNWFGFLHNQETSGPSVDGVTYRRPTYINPWLRDNQSPLEQYTGHLTDILTQRAVAFLDRQKAGDAPWFLNLWYYAPHAPIQPPDEFRRQFPATEAGAYHALVAHLDSSIGQVLDALDRNAQGDNTLVIVLSDNGGANTHVENNYPFHGKKGGFLEGGVRTPMLMRWPGHIRPDTVSDELVSVLDIFPTIAHASSAKPPRHLIGRSLLDPRRGPMPQLYWEYSNSETHSYAVLSTDGRWRLTTNSYGTTLYDLTADPSGKVSVVEQHPQVAEQMTEDYLQWRKAARQVDFDYMPLNNRGGAILRGDDLQRSPGYSGFTFAIGVTPAPDAGARPQVIAEQSGRWKLQITAGQDLVLDILDQTLVTPPLPSGRCSELVVSSHFNFTTIRPENNWSVVDLYVNGARVHSLRTERPPLQTWGYANPTYIGFDAGGNASFDGELSRPIILNERVVPDEQSAMIGNGISGAPLTCAPVQNEIDASSP